MDGILLLARGDPIAFGSGLRPREMQVALFALRPRRAVQRQRLSEVPQLEPGVWAVSRLDVWVLRLQERAAQQVLQVWGEAAVRTVGVSVCTTTEIGRWASQELSGRRAVPTLR